MSDLLIDWICYYYCSITGIDIMLTGRQKIVKANGAEPDEFEASVAQELLNLEVSGGDEESGEGEGGEGVPAGWGEWCSGVSSWVVLVE